MYYCFPDWHDKANHAIGRFTNHLRKWLGEFEHPVHVLVAEELQKNTLWELYKVSKFINFPVTFKRMWCVKWNQRIQTAYLRKKPEWLQPQNVFSVESQRLINTKLRDLIKDTSIKYNVTSALQSYIIDIPNYY